MLLTDTANQQQLSKAERLRLFDQARDRQREREKTATASARPSSDRGWTREELYDRGEPD